METNDRQGKPNGGESGVNIEANREWWSPKELQEWLGCGKSMTYNLLNSPDGVPNYRIGRKIFVRKQDAIAWLEEKRYRPEDLR